jgi:hypothetical protein
MLPGLKYKTIWLLAGHAGRRRRTGIVSLEGMIAAAEARGYEYYAVTDHAPMGL